MGILSGCYGGWTDGVISRALEVFIVVPFLLGALLLLALFRGRGSSENLIASVPPRRWRSRCSAGWSSPGTCGRRP